MFQPQPILQSDFLDPPWRFPKGTSLPGIGPVEADNWLLVDDVFSEQMALRDVLISQASEKVLAMLPDAEDASCEALEEAIKILVTKRYLKLSDGQIERPDGVRIQLDWTQPLKSLGRLVQEDICILQHNGEAHELTGAILCFPASWNLGEKIGKPLIGVHQPVEEYNDNVATRVQRLFDGLRPGHVIRRSNCLEYEHFALFQPRSEDNRRKSYGAHSPYVRTERQCLLKLPKTGAVVFSIHTCVLAVSAVSAEDRAQIRALSDLKPIRY